MQIQIGFDSNVRGGRRGRRQFGRRWRGLPGTSCGPFLNSATERELQWQQRRVSNFGLHIGKAMRLLRT